MRLRRVHRLLGLVLGLPALLWGLSGALLAWKNWVRDAEPTALATAAERPFRISLAAALAAAKATDEQPSHVPQSVEWRHLAGQPVYVIRLIEAGSPRVALIDGESGQALAGIDAELARRIAALEAPSGVTIRGCTLQTAPSLIYLDGMELPVYRVELSDGSDVYLSPKSGEVFFRAPRLALAIRVAFYYLHVWNFSSAPGQHHSYLLLMLMALLLCAVGVSGLWLALVPKKRA